jgi:hypothetical protein
MRIPKHTEKPRFYVAIGDHEAFSSWSSLEEARASVRRLQDFATHESNHYAADYARITGIVEVEGACRTTHPAEEG